MDAVQRRASEANRRAIHVQRGSQKASTWSALLTSAAPPQTTSHSQVLHVAQLDSGPGFQDILGAIHNRYGDASYPVTPNVRSEVNGDWDVLYPISAFIEAEKFTLPPGEATEHSLPQVKIDVVEDSYDASAKERTVRLKVAYVSPRASEKGSLLIALVAARPRIPR